MIQRPSDCMLFLPGISLSSLALCFVKTLDSYGHFVRGQARQGVLIPAAF